MELQKEVVLFQPTAGPDPDACPKCRSHMDPYDGADVKGINYRGKLCPKCSWFVGVRSKGQHSGGHIDPRKYGKFEENFTGRIRTKDRFDRSE
jgi:hypothetical protein